jgi:anti-sigma factor RsiW
MNECDLIRDGFSGYLDGAVSGAAMQKISRHLEECPACASEFAEWRNAQVLLSSLGPAKAPKDLSLRLRVALSHEAAHSTRENLDRWRIRWENTVRPLILQFSAGLASTLLLIGSVSLLVGMFASPEPLSARDQPLGMASAPRFLYSSVEPAGAIGDRDNPVIVEAFINREGRVYDYKIVSGTTDMRTSTQLQNALLFSVFDPARTFGEPVPGMVVLSFSGVSVHG